MGTEPQLYHLPGFYEPFSAVSHLVGTLIFLFLGWLLVVRARDNRGGFRYVAVFAAVVVLQMLISGLFHMPPRGSPIHRVAERVDHAAIFVMIAGTFTPALGILFGNRLRTRGLALIWCAALLGATVKTIFFDYLPEWLGLTMYLAMGWLGALVVVAAARRYSVKFVQPLLIGGIVYSVGAVLEFFQCAYVVPGVIHAHEVHHLTVLIGAFWHWVWVWQFATWEPRGQPVPDSFEEPSPQTA